LRSRPRRGRPVAGRIGGRHPVAARIIVDAPAGLPGVAHRPESADAAHQINEGRLANRRAEIGRRRAIDFGEALLVDQPVEVGHRLLGRILFLAGRAAGERQRHHARNRSMSHHWPPPVAPGRLTDRGGREKESRVMDERSAGPARIGRHRGRWRMALVAAALAVLMPGIAAGQPAAPEAASAPVADEARAPVTILVSIDGFRADYLDRGLTPNLSRLAAEGVRAAMRPCYPTKTFPNHYALVTRLRPDRNGIVDNRMEDARRPGVTFTLGDPRQSVDPFWW